MRTWFLKTVGLLLVSFLVAFETNQGVTLTHLRILCVQHFCSSDAMLFNCKPAYKNGIHCYLFSLFVFFVCLSMFVISHFLLTIADLEDILC